MPIKQCTKDGKSGWKFGDSGKCFTGPGARERARKQGAAIKISQQKSKGTPNKTWVLEDLKEYINDKSLTFKEQLEVALLINAKEKPKL